MASPRRTTAGTTTLTFEVERLRKEGEDEKADQLETIMEGNGSADDATDIDVRVGERGLVRRMS